MQKNNFEAVVASIARDDKRYHISAYRFVRESLDYTLKTLKRTSPASQRHVSGPELLEGIKQYTLKEFGPMSKLVLNEWGINCCEDFGQIVFNLVQHGVLGKSDSDRLEDFSEIFTFDEAFVKPFLPEKEGQVKRRSRKPATGKSRVMKGKSGKSSKKDSSGQDSSLKSSSQE